MGLILEHIESKKTPYNCWGVFLRLNLRHPTASNFEPGSSHDPVQGRVSAAGTRGCQVTIYCCIYC